MRKRDKGFILRLTEEELNRINNDAREAGMNRSAYMRKILMESVVLDAPKGDCKALADRFQQVDMELNEILRKSNEFGFLDEPALRRAMNDNHAAEELAWQTFGSELH